MHTPNKMGVYMCYNRFVTPAVAVLYKVNFRIKCAHYLGCYVNNFDVMLHN